MRNGATRRPGFTYRPEQAIQAFQKARYIQVLLYRIRPARNSRRSRSVSDEFAGADPGFWRGKAQ
jgi:hypothetical protein